MTASVLRTLAGAGALAAATAGTLVAQVAPTTRDTAALRPVVVTATRVAQPQTAPTATATVISGETLRQRGITHLADALRDVPGMAVLQNGSFGANTSLFLRGGDSKYTLVLVDGVPVNQAGGAFNWANVTTDNVDRVEILRGPASVLYGSDAVSGVVQLFTRRGAPGTRASLAARGGSYGSTEGELSAAGRAGALGWSLGAARYGTAGLVDTAGFDNRYRNASLNGAVRYAGALGDATLAVRGQQARYHFPTNGSGRIVDRNAFRDDERATVSLDAGHRLRDDLELRTTLGLAGLRGRNDDRPDDATRNTGYVSRDGTTRRNADLHLDWRPVGGTVVTLGGDYRETAFQSVDTTISGTRLTPGTRFAPQRDNRAAYAQLLTDVQRRVSVTLGGRYDDNSAFGAFRTVRAGLGVRLTPSTRLRAAAGNAFREPTLPENFARSSFERGNPLLRPERTRSFEAGIEQGLLGDRVTLAGTWFLQNFRDIVQYGRLTPVAGTRDSANYFNVARANAGGAELELRTAPVRGISSTLSWSVIDTRVVDPGFQTGANATYVRGGRLLRRPTTLGALALAAPLADRGSVTLRVNYTGRRDDIDFASFRRGTLGGFATVGLGSELALLRGAPGGTSLWLTARGDNLLDRAYTPYYGFAAPGRTLLVGLRLDAAR